MVVQLQSLQTPCPCDLSSPLRYCTCRSTRGFVRLMELGVGYNYGSPKVLGFLCESKYLPLLFLTLFVKQREELVVIREDWMRRAIH